MKKINSRRMNIIKAWFHSQLVMSFKRTFGIISGESESTSDLQVSVKRLPQVSLAYNGHQGMNVQLLEMQVHKAEAMQLIRERTRLT